MVTLRPTTPPRLPNPGRGMRWVFRADVAAWVIERSFGVTDGSEAQRLLDCYTPKGLAGFYYPVRYVIREEPW